MTGTWEQTGCIEEEFEQRQERNLGNTQVRGQRLSEEVG